MKLLQVNNVPTKLGGTGACAFTITKALPDWSHEIAFVCGERGNKQKVSSEFECDCHLLSGLKPHHIETINPDVILYHNTMPDRMPNHVPDNIPTVFYQHSALKAFRASRQKCDLFLAVSKYLADTANIADEFILYQPVPIPPNPEDVPRKRLIGGRICTPKMNKWEGSDRLFDKLSSDHQEITWHFVGCPSQLQQTFMDATAQHANFKDASWDMRRLYWQWSFVVYNSDVKETYGRIVCEAQRAGCIPIVSDHSGLAEQIENGVDGFRCLSDDEFSWAINDAKQNFQTISEQCRKSGDLRGSLKTWREKFLTWVGAISQYQTTHRKTV